MLSKPTRKELRATLHPLRRQAEDCAMRRIWSCGTVAQTPPNIWWRGFDIAVTIIPRDKEDVFADEPYNLYQIRYRLIFMGEPVAEGFNGSDFVREVFKAFATVPTLLDMAMQEIRRKLSDVDNPVAIISGNYAPDNPYYNKWIDNSFIGKTGEIPFRSMFLNDWDFAATAQAVHKREDVDAMLKDGKITRREAEAMLRERYATTTTR